jgi:LCP family protein required for cell wall assembly
LSHEWPPEDGGYADAYGYERRGVNTALIIAIGVFTVFTFYSALIVSSQLDQIFLPGNELSLPVVKALPGVEQPEDKDAADTIEERINILFMGLDRRIDEAENQPYRTDSVMILTIDPFSKTAGAFSIPRDTVVEIPDEDGSIYTEDRINVVYEMGEYLDLKGYPGGGAQLAMDTIERNFDIPIDHYVVMDFVDFIDIINELGGVDINVPEYAYDPAYTICSYCYDYYPVEFVPGTEHMDGERALAYARLRKSDNDFKRIERQQIVLRATARKAASIEAIASNPIGLYNKFKGAIQTDISDFRAAGLAVLAKQVGVDKIRTVSMAPATYPCNYCTAAMLLWDPVKAEELKAQVFSDAIVIQESASVEVLNGTPLPDLATTFASQMRTRGIPPEKISIDEYADGLLYDTTVVIDVSGAGQHTAAQVAGWLGLSEDHVISADDPQAAAFLDSVSDVVVVLGQDVDYDVNGDLAVTTTQTGG